MLNSVKGIGTSREVVSRPSLITVSLSYGVTHYYS